MNRLLSLSSTTVLDTCCIINLVATGRLEDIIQSLPMPVRITTIVFEAELRQGIDRGDLHYAIAAGLLQLVHLESKEFQTLTDFAALGIGNGEAECASIAYHRGWAIVTDDTRARSKIAQEIPTTALLSTLDLLEHWATYTHQSLAEIREALEAVRDIGNYTPASNHPRWNWWCNILDLSR